MKTTPYSFRLPFDLKHYLSKYASHIGLRESEALRHILLSHIEEHYWKDAKLDDEGNEILPF